MNVFQIMQLCLLDNNTRGLNSARGSCGLLLLFLCTLLSCSYFLSLRELHERV